MSTPDMSYLQRGLRARSAIRGFASYEPPPPKNDVRTAWAMLGDRFTIVLGGTENEQQALAYVLTHALGQQVSLNAGWVNLTFGRQARYLGSLIVAAWNAELSPPLLILGHSMGGAIAPAILWEFRQRACIEYDRIVTFGAPRSLTASACAKLPPAQFLRLVLELDPVTYLPPPQSIIQAVSPPAAVGGFPGGDYQECGPRLQMEGGAGITPINAVPMNALTWQARFSNFIENRLDYSWHFARTYVDAAKGYHLGGRGDVDISGFVDFDSLFQLDADLAAIGL